jgi:hypothetical protein
MNTKTPIAAIIAVSLLSGCATVTRGTTQDVAVDSTPQGATVTTTGGATYTTPAVLKLKRNHSHRIDFAKQGYVSESRHVTPSIGGGGAAGMAGNILVGGIIGAAVDAGSGAMYDLTPSHLHAVMTRVDQQP